MKNQIAYNHSEESSAKIRRIHHRLTDRIGVKLAHGIECILLDKILCCEAWGNYCKIHLADRKEPLLVSRTLKYVNAVLPERLFYRVHQSFVIRIDMIQSIGDEIILNNGMMIPMSRAQKPEFLSWVKSNITLI